MHEQDNSGIFENPLIVFAGRSNVGKSSTIKALTGVKMRVGKKPGSTTWEKRIDMGSVVFVDFPGFGYMSGKSKKEIEETKRVIIQQLEQESHRLLLGVLVLDASLFSDLVARWESRGEIPIDIEFYTFLSEIASHVIVVANKIDKIKKKNQHEEMEFLRYKLIEAIPSVEPSIVATSVSRGVGVSRLKRLIHEIIVEAGFEPLQW